MYFIALLALCGLCFGDDNNKGPCNPNLLYDATLVYVADVEDSFSNLGGLMDEKVFKELSPFCVDFFHTRFGLSTEDFWTGGTPLPCGMSGFNASGTPYRLYGAATPQFKDNFPLTNGRVEDDSFVIIFEQDTRLGGTFRKDMMMMNMSNVVPAGSFITCGQYQGFENDTMTMQKEIFPPIRYRGMMPMPIMYAGPEKSFYNADVTIMCDLSSPLWGEGLAVGMSSIRTLPGGRLSLLIRNMLTFPASIYQRTWAPKYRRCEPLHEC